MNSHKRKQLLLFGIAGLVCVVGLVTFADEMRIAVGQSSDEAIAAIKKHGGKDITPGLEIVGSKGKHPLTGMYWKFRNYDAIISLAMKDGKVAGMTFWTKKDFGESKIRRDKAEQSIIALKLNTKTRRVSIEEQKNARQSASPRDLFAMIEISMTRAEVEKLLGAPFLPELSRGGNAWYLQPPRIGFHESPAAPGTIGVQFTADGKVASKQLNGQFRDNATDKVDSKTQ